MSTKHKAKKKSMITKEPRGPIKETTKNPITLCVGCKQHHESKTLRIAHGAHRLTIIYFKLLACASKNGWFFITIDGLLLVTSILFIFTELPAIDEGIKAFVERFAEVQEDME